MSISWGRVDYGKHFEQEVFLNFLSFSDDAVVVQKNEDKL